MKKYLVTGGAGFIGSNLAFELESAGHKVTILDDFSSGNFKNLLAFKGDILAYSLCDVTWADILMEEKFDAIFHEAAITDTTIHDQKKMMEDNVEGFRHILNYAVATGVKKVVYASSAGVYGNGKCPMAETNVPTPENVYGFSKAIMDNVAREYAEENKGMSIVGLRYFNVYGPREYYKGKTASMMYQLYLQMKEGKRPRIFKHGEQERDFVYVKDVIKANMCALNYKGNGVFNVATGIPENFNKVVECLNKGLKTKLEPDYFDNPYPFYQNKTQAEMSASNKELKFTPDYSLEKGIEDYVNILEKR
jgi:ADP-L-glycero-D-manno-heptose 6-epimerase